MMFKKRNDPLIDKRHIITYYIIYNSFSLPFSLKHEIIINFVNFRTRFSFNFSFTNGETLNIEKNSNSRTLMQ